MVKKCVFVALLCSEQRFEESGDSFVQGDLQRGGKGNLFEGADLLQELVGREFGRGAEAETYARFGLIAKHILPVESELEGVVLEAMVVEHHGPVLGQWCTEGYGEQVEDHDRWFVRVDICAGPEVAPVEAIVGEESREDASPLVLVVEHGQATLFLPEALHLGGDQVVLNVVICVEVLHVIRNRVQR